MYSFCIFLRNFLRLKIFYLRDNYETPKSTFKRFFIKKVLRFEELF